jgi:serine/threonine protein kinase
VLVDFGIAKEYHVDATTTAIRHCSPGFSAPEQYSSVGTDPRADIYGLGATCYALLAGATPADALQRLTTLASKGRDPLVRLDELEPSVPGAVADVIQRALALNAEERFSNPGLFWQELKRASTSRRPARQTSATRSARPRVRPEARPLSRVVATICILILLAGIGGGVWATLFAQHNTVNSHVQASKHTTPRLPGPVAVPALAASYIGTLHSLQSGQTFEITLAQIQQDHLTIKGNLVELHTKITRSFSGVVDSSRHLLFTLQAGGGQEELFFEGVVRDDGNLVGNYCHLDQGAQCIGDYGLWSVSPHL